MQRDVEQTRTRQCSRALSRAARRSPHLAHLFLLEDTLTSERSASLLVICLPTQVRPNKSYWPLTFVRVQSCFIGLRGSKRNLRKLRGGTEESKLRGGTIPHQSRCLEFHKTSLSPLRVSDLILETLQCTIPDCRNCQGCRALSGLSGSVGLCRPVGLSACRPLSACLDSS